MAIIKCKMCGGDLNIEEGMTVCECEYCGSKQTVPSADSEKKLTLFARANRLRAACEFDKAAGVYESIVADFPEEAEAYWGLVLCRYGIEYVDDPATGKKVPTCHRSSFESIMEDADFDQACENADAIARRVYRDEAKQLEEIRKGIIEVSGKEEPYDIFICYKETAENGERTLDSVIAQDVYDALTDKGYRVFFSRISLEDKLGTEYEPYIFAALNSAKLMLAFGTDYEYYNAVWVKNEWSRFLKLMAVDKSKHLIPCYKGIDAYDMPQEFAKLQAQDMGKVGATQDLLRGIEKILPKNKSEQTTVQQTVVQAASGGPNSYSLLKRGFMALEDGEWDKANGFFEEVLNMDAECAEAYLGKLMAELKVGKRENLKDCEKPFDGSKYYQKVLRFGDTALANEVKAANDSIIVRNMKCEERRIAKLAEVREWIHPAAHLIAAGGSHTLGLKSDGTVVATKYKGDLEYYYGQCDIDGWYDIVAVAVGGTHTIGLKSDGTVVATEYTGDKEFYSGQDKVSGWRDIVAIAAGGYHTVGLKSDGTVVATKYTGDPKRYCGQCEVSGWRNIVAIAAGAAHTVGLKSDGTVVATKDTGDPKYYRGACEVSGWRDIIAIAAGGTHTVGLKADGTVVTTEYKYTGDPKYRYGQYCGQCEVSGWRDIVAIAAGNRYTVGLKADGTVIATKYTGDLEYYYGQCDIDGWRDIVAISADFYHTVGLKTDGTVVATEYTGDKAFYYGQCDVDGWKLFNSIDTLAEERVTAMKATNERRIVEEKAAEQCRIAEAKAAEEQRIARIAVLNSEKSALSTELANLKGLFIGKRRKEIEARLEEIDAELAKLNSNGQSAMQYTCPNCGEYLTLGQSICENCGQEIAWE